MSQIEVDVRVIIMKDNQVLFLKDKKGDWVIPGGKLNFGEEFEQAVRRKVTAELGLNLKKVKIICVNNDIGTGVHNVTVGALSDEWEGNPEIKSPEFTDLSWFSIDDSPFPVNMSSAKILLNYKKGKFYFMN